VQWTCRWVARVLLFPILAPRPELSLPLGLPLLPRLPLPLLVRELLRARDRPPARASENISLTRQLRLMFPLFLAGPLEQSYFSKSTSGLQKVCALRQGAHNGVARHGSEIFPG
jgi:hypothetical protein